MEVPLAAQASLAEKLRQRFTDGKAVGLSAAESACFQAVLRQAVAVTLECEASDISDESLLFSDLGLDSIDVFDLLDQLSETFEIVIELEALPEELLKGGESITFSEFSQAFLSYFQQPASPAEAGSQA